MAFPDDPRDVELSILIDGVWVDAVTTGEGVRTASSSVRVRAGRSNWGGSADPAQMDFTLDNRDGRWSPRNSSGAYAGLLRRNLPVRYGIRHGTTYLGRGVEVDANPMATTPDAAALDITGDIDIRIDLQLEEDIASPNDGGFYYRVATKGDGIDSGWSWYLFRNAAGELDMIVDWHDGAWTTYYLTDSGVALSEVYQHQRTQLRFTLDVSTGEGIFWEPDLIEGTWSGIGDPITSAGATSITANSWPLEVGASTFDLSTKPFPGRIFSFELRSGIDGTVVADPVFEGLAAGTTSFADSSRTWTVGDGGRITNTRWRFHGEMTSWPTRWNIDGSDSWSPVTAAGLLRRLRRRPDVRSVPRRYIERDVHNTMVQYWSCEDRGTRATDQFGATVGTAPLTISGGEPQPASYQGFLGSLPLPTLDADVWSVTVDAHTPSASGWTVRWHLWVPEDWTGTNVTVLDVRTATHRFLVQMSSGGTGTMRVLVQNSGGSTLYTSASTAFEQIGTHRRFHLGVFDNAGNINIRFYATTENVGSAGGVVYATGVTAAPGTVATITVNPNGAAGGYSLGHLLLLGSDVGITIAMSNEITSWAGETAADRIRRLCIEDGVRSRIYGDPALSAEMGPQFPDTIGNLLQECADTDLGILHEATESTAVAYRTRSSMLAQTPVLVFDAADLSDPLEPDEDDADIANDWEVRNAQGGTARAVLNDGSALSVSEPPIGVGRYPQSVQVSAPSADLQTIADRLLAIGTVDEPRVSRLPIGLHYPAISSSEARTTAILEARIGDLVTVANNLPEWDSSTISQIIQGWTQDTANLEDFVSYLTSSAAPFADPDEMGGGAQLTVFGVDSANGVDAQAVDNPLLGTDGGTLLCISVATGPSNEATSGSAFWVAPSGGTQVFDYAGSGFVSRVRCWLVESDGSESTVTFGWETNAGNPCTCVVVGLDGDHIDFDVTATPSVTGGTTSSTYPTLTTESGWLVLACAASQVGDDLTSGPTGYIEEFNNTAALSSRGVAVHSATSGSTSITPSNSTWNASAGAHIQWVFSFTNGGSGSGSTPVPPPGPAAARISNANLLVDLDATDETTWGKDRAEGQWVVGGGRFNPGNDDNWNSLVWEADDMTINGAFAMQDGETERLQQSTYAGVTVVESAFQYVADGSYVFQSGLANTSTNSITDKLYFDGNRSTMSHIAIGIPCGPGANPTVIGVSFVVEPWMFADDYTSGPWSLHAPDVYRTGPIGNSIRNGVLSLSGKYSTTGIDPANTSNIAGSWGAPVGLALPAVGEWVTSVVEFVNDPGGSGYLNWWTLDHDTGAMELLTSMGSNWGWLYNEAAGAYVDQNNEFYLNMPSHYQFHQFTPPGISENWDAAGAASAGASFPNVRRLRWAYAAATQVATPSQMVGHAKFFLGIS